jgi:hypothetical protein
MSSLSFISLFLSLSSFTVWVPTTLESEAILNDVKAWGGVYTVGKHSSRWCRFFCFILFAFASLFFHGDDVTVAFDIMSAREK